jgi:hypothetical protein
MKLKQRYDLIVVGAGAAGIIAAITAARLNDKVLLLEKLPQIASKLKATGGGRCNLTNTLNNEEFMSKFGRNGRFMQDALKEFDYKTLINFFKEIGVDTHAPDGFRVFPTSHNSSTIISALIDEMQRVGVEVLVSQRVEKLLVTNNQISGIQTTNNIFNTKRVIVATGGLGYPTLGADGDGYKMAQELGHKVTQLYPAMMPLYTKEKWVKNCRADTIAKVELRVDMKKQSKIKVYGDLIFTKNGIRGPVVLDAARDLTPLLEKYGEVPILLNFTKGMNEEQITKYLKELFSKAPHLTILELVNTLLPLELSNEICKLAGVEAHLSYKKIAGEQRAKLINLLAWTPLTVIGHEGFKMAMITRGGVDLREINPKTMQSKIVDGLYFCGEILNLDGPCGGYNLQWSFASGYLAGASFSKNTFIENI